MCHLGAIAGIIFESRNQLSQTSAGSETMEIPSLSRLKGENAHSRLFLGSNKG